MQCHEFEQVLEQQAEDQLPAGAAAHLNDCGHCRALISDLGAIRGAARQMGAIDAQPAERVWVSLRAQLEAEGLIRTEDKAARGAGWLVGWLAGLQRPALAGAYLFLLLVAAALVGTQGILRQAQVARQVVPPPATAALGSQLNTVARRAVSALHKHDPAVTASLRQNLDIVDNFIALCEKSVHEEPQSELAREYLYGAYQQKAELLAMMVDRDATGD